MSNEVKGQPKGPLPAPSAHADGHGMGTASGCVGNPKHLEPLLINSHCPIISVESSEEDRFAVLLRCVAADIGLPLYLGVSGSCGHEERGILVVSLKHIEKESGCVWCEHP